MPSTTDWQDADADVLEISLYEIGTYTLGNAFGHVVSAHQLLSHCNPSDSIFSGLLSDRGTCELASSMVWASESTALGMILQKMPGWIPLRDCLGRLAAPSIAPACMTGSISTLHISH